MYSLTGARFRVPIGHNYCVRPDHSLYPSLDSNRRDSRLVDPNIPIALHAISEEFLNFPVLTSCLVPQPPLALAQLRSCLEDWVSRSVTCPKKEKKKRKNLEFTYCALLSVCSCAGFSSWEGIPPLPHGSPLQ